MFHLYTAEEVAELTVLADEARALEQEWRAVMDEISGLLDALLGRRYCGWQWYHPELHDIAEVIKFDYQVAPYEQLPQVGHGAYKRIHRTKEWRRLNNRCRKEIAAARRALACHQQAAHA